MKNVYFDRHYRNVLFSMALDEMLLERGDSNYWSHVYAADNITREDKEIVLSNITASQIVYLPPEEGIPRGKLFDDQKFELLSYEKEADLTRDRDKGFSFFPDFECLSAFLEANGRSLTPTEFTEMFEKYMTLSDRFKHEFPGTTLLQAQLQEIIESAAARKGPAQPGTNRALINEYAEIDRKLSELIHPIQRFGGLIQLSQTMSARVLTESITLPATRNIAVQQAPLALIDTAGRKLINRPEDQQLFEIVAFELGSTPFRSTLRETIELAAQDESLALRSFVSERLQKLEEGELEAIKDVRNEIQKASRKMVAAEKRNLVSTMLTYVGLPVGIIGLISNEVALFGLGLAAVGYYATLRNQRILDSLKWMMFGKKPINSAPQENISHG
jgi:hypothetical protein